MEVIAQSRHRVLVITEPHAKDSDASQAPTLSHNGKLYPTERSAEPQSLLYGRNLLWNADFKDGPKGWAPKKKGDFALGLDLKGYTLEDGHTLYLRQKGGKAIAAARYMGNGEGGVIPVVGGLHYLLQCHIGLLRADGYITIGFLDRKKKPLHKQTIAIPRGYKRGGPELDRDYFLIREKFQIPEKAVWISIDLGIERMALREGEKAGDSDIALFLTQPILALTNETMKVGGFAPATEEDRQLYRKLIEGKAVWTLPDTPEGHLPVGTDSVTVLCDGEQLEADIPDLPLPQAGGRAAAGGMEAAVPPGQVALPLPLDPLTHRAGGLTLCVDGTIAASFLWDPEKEFDGQRLLIPIPGVFMDGEAHALEVFDRYGRRIWADARMLSTWQTSWYDILRHSTPPHEGKLAPIAGYRMKALEEQLGRVAQADDPAGFAEQIHYCYKLLERGYPFITEFKPLVFPRQEKPAVSVVVAAHNKFTSTYACMASLLFAPNEASFEVILVDDGSSDETLDAAQIFQNVTCIRHEEAQGFQGAATAGADAARGDYIVLLNNDTEVFAHWLDELLYPFSRWAGVGATGAKLVFADGRIQDAGGVIRTGGKPLNYARTQRGGAVNANYTRQTDYLTGAALMVKHSVWKEVGGFSPEFSPAYYEDTDIAFKIREHGYKTIYTPKSVVLHYEGVSHGRDMADKSSFKYYMTVNGPKFEKKWAHVFGTQAIEDEDIDIIKDRGIKGRVLFIDNEVPRPDYDAGSYAALQEIRMFQELGYKVSFLPANRAYLGKYTENLQREGVEVLYAPYVISVHDFLEERGREFDYVFVTRYYVAQHFIDSIRRGAPQAKLLFNNADCHFLREMRAALASGNDDAMVEARKVQTQELDVMRAADLNFSYSDAEKEIMDSHLMGAAPVARLPWVQGLAPRPEGPREGLMFLGGFGHKPNLESLEFLAKHVMPELQRTQPDIVLYVYGSRTTDEIRAYETDNIRIMGQIPDPADGHAQHKMFIAPLISGAGIKGKVLAAMAAGMPVLMSPVAAEGILPGSNDLVQSDMDGKAWAARIAALYHDEKKLEAMGRAALHRIEEGFSLQAATTHLAAVLEAL